MNGDHNSFLVLAVVVTFYFRYSNREGDWDCGALGVGEEGGGAAGDSQLHSIHHTHDLLMEHWRLLLPIGFGNQISNLSFNVTVLPSFYWLCQRDGALTCRRQSTSCHVRGLIHEWAERPCWYPWPSSLSLQWRHWSRDTLLTDDDAVHRNVSIRYV